VYGISAISEDISQLESYVKLYKDSGHIGYSVRPSQRKKSYATEILRKILEIAKKQGLTEVYLVCKKDNDASKKTIIKNYGSLNRTFKNNEVEYEEYHISF
jgi:predicted acetyltransferase